jgi:PAS domain-containing protein
MLVNSAGEQKKDQEALLEYKEKYLILTDLMPLGVFRLGPGPEFPVLSANPMLYKMLGYDAEDSLIGISAREIITNPVHWQQIDDDWVSDRHRWA